MQNTILKYDVKQPTTFRKISDIKMIRTVWINNCTQIFFLSIPLKSTWQKNSYDPAANWVIRPYSALHPQSSIPFLIGKIILGYLLKVTTKTIWSNCKAIMNSPAGVCSFTCRWTVLWRKVNKAPLSSVSSRRHSFKLKYKTRFHLKQFKSWFKNKQTPRSATFHNTTCDTIWTIWISNENAIASAASDFNQFNYSQLANNLRHHDV